MEFKEYLDKSSEKVEIFKKIFDKSELLVSYDILLKEKETQSELLYFNYVDKEIKGMFVFGFDYFIKELEEQEFKKIITNNSMNFKILHAYTILKKKQKKILVSDILNELQNKTKDSMLVHDYLRRILSLAYYMNWKLEKDNKNIENDYIIEIPENYLVKLKTRFNYEVRLNIYEDENVFVFLNGKDVLNLVFKHKNSFTKKDIETTVFKVLCKIFKIKSVNILE